MLFCWSVIAIRCSCSGCYSEQLYSRRPTCCHQTHRSTHSTNCCRSLARVITIIYFNSYISIT